MSKSFLITLLAVTGAALWTDNADARCRRGYRQTYVTNSVAAAPMIAAPAMAATVQPGTPVAQSNSTYQSYSYEPGQNNVVVAPSPSMARQRGNYEYNNVLRGDRKVRGHTAEAE